MKEHLAKFFSYIFHPLLMPVYAVIVLFYLPSYLSNYQYAYKKAITLVVFLSTFITPLLIMLILLNLKIISDLQLSKRNERFYPLAIVGVLFIASYIITIKLPAGVPNYISNFILLSAIIIFILLLINLKLKVSLHSSGIGGFLGFFLVFLNKENLNGILLSFAGLNFTAVHFIAFLFLLAGIIMTSRLILKSHDIKEITIGFFVGFTLGLLSIFLK